MERRWDGETVGRFKSQKTMPRRTLQSADASARTDAPRLGGLCTRSGDEGHDELYTSTAFAPVFSSRFTHTPLRSCWAEPIQQVEVV
ncbi:hypothetical protein EYF80_010492 [Liparis tanakae]|uniref:Uncharacterized protein n=1 Tax=Liparis tanakae TaxID=230148 RepID=A0A4Z2IN99_9TELE|nr:hypothetical protein EYF80_010492 [Liparis tanakae]